MAFERDLPLGEVKRIQRGLKSKTDYATTETGKTRLF